MTGLIAAPFTPMHKDGSLNLAVIPAYYALLKNNGITGAFICGSTGEGVSLTNQEKRAVAKSWADVTKNDPAFKVISLLGGTSVRECMELAIHARESGLYAVAFTSPFYFKPANVKVLADMCMEIASVVPDMPFYYYHIPVLTGVGFNMIDLLQQIHGKCPNFAGVKFTHEDFMDFLSCLHFENEQYDMLWGRDENMLPALSVGAKGAVGSTFNYAAPLYNQLIDAYNNGEMEKARALQQQSIDMIRLLGKYGGIATGKAYMKVAGLDCGEFRKPVSNMSRERFEAFVKDVASLNFSAYCSKFPATVNS